MKKIKLLIILCLFLFSNSISFATVLNYDLAENWAINEKNIQKPVDVFLIPTTLYFSRDPKTLNMSMSDDLTKNKIQNQLRIEKYLYSHNARVFSPFYQQAHISVFFMSDGIKKSYLDEAYKDIKAAFNYYMKNYNDDRPFIIAGYSQGAVMGLDLMKDFAQNPNFQKKLVAAYLIGWRLTPEDLKKYPYLKTAKKPDDTGVIVMWNTEAKGTKSSLFVPVKSYGINPITWTTSSKKANKKLNTLAVFFSDGKIIEKIPNLTGGYLSKRGTMIATDINEEKYSLSGYFFGKGNYHLYDLKFFYKNIQENVTLRIDSYFKNR